MKFIGKINHYKQHINPLLTININTIDLLLVLEMDIIVLDGAVVRVFQNFRNDVYAMPQEEADENCVMRHAA